MEERDETRRVRIGERLSYANVMATVAVFIALGGSAWAVAANSIGPKELKKNAVRAKHVKKNQIRAKHIKKNQVRPKHIRGGSVRTGKISDGAVTSSKVADGSLALADLAASSVDSSKVADDSLTGDDVDESSLGQVPNAANAANADRVDGVDVIPVFERLAPNERQLVTSIGGLDLSLDCDVTSDAGLHIAFSPPATAYRLVRIDSAGTSLSTEQNNASAGAVLAGSDELLLLSATSGGKALNAQIQGWDAGTNALGQPQCLHSGFVMVEG